MFSPHLCVGFLFLVVHSRLPPPPPAASLRPNLLTHNLLTPNLITHTQLTHTQLVHIQLVQTLSTHNLLTHNLLTPNLFTHNLSTHSLFTHNLFTHNLLTHNLFTHNLLTCPHTTRSHTHNLSTHSLFTHNLLTHNLSTHSLFTHTTCSHTTCPHTACSHTTYSHTSCSHCVALGDIDLRGRRGRRGTSRHGPSLCVAGVALMALGCLWWHAWFPFDAVVAAAVGVAGVELATSTFTSRGRGGTWRHPRCKWVHLSQIRLCHTQLFHTQLFHTQVYTTLSQTIFHTHTHNFVTHNSSHTNDRSSTISFVLSSFSVPLQPLFLTVGRNWLVGLSGPLILMICWYSFFLVHVVHFVQVLSPRCPSLPGWRRRGRELSGLSEMSDRCQMVSDGLRLTQILYGFIKFDLNSTWSYSNSD